MTEFSEDARNFFYFSISLFLHIYLLKRIYLQSSKNPH